MALISQNKEKDYKELFEDLISLLACDTDSMDSTRIISILLTIRFKEKKMPLEYLGFKSYVFQIHLVETINQLKATIDNMFVQNNTTFLSAQKIYARLRMRNKTLLNKMAIVEGYYDLFSLIQSLFNEECLRISDFNTTGLYGLKDEDSPWHYLIHGTGLSSKSGSSGGSKGIGKYATFVASAFNTVFYETRRIL